MWTSYLEAPTEQLRRGRRRVANERGKEGKEGPLLLLLTSVSLAPIKHLEKRILCLGKVTVQLENTLLQYLFILKKLATRAAMQ